MVEIHPSIVITKIDFNNTELHIEKTNVSLDFFKSNNKLWLRHISETKEPRKVESKGNENDKQGEYKFKKPGVSMMILIYQP